MDANCCCFSDESPYQSYFLWESASPLPRGPGQGCGSHCPAPPSGALGFCTPRKPEPKGVEDRGSSKDTTWTQNQLGYMSLCELGFLWFAECWLVCQAITKSHGISFNYWSSVIGEEGDGVFWKVFQKSSWWMVMSGSSGGGKKTHKWLHKIRNVPIGGSLWEEPRHWHLSD